MATVKSQIPDKAKEAKAAAQAANSVIALRDAVLQLIEEVEEQKKRIAKLESKTGR